MTSPPANRGALVKGEFGGRGASMKLCFSFVAKLSTKMQNETQFLMNTVVKINTKKFQQFLKIDFSGPLNVWEIEYSRNWTRFLIMLYRVT